MNEESKTAAEPIFENLVAEPEGELWAQRAFFYEIRIFGLTNPKKALACPLSCVYTSNLPRNKLHRINF